MKLTPLFTEKSMNDAKEGVYTFIAPLGFTKNKIKEVIRDVFNVNVKDIRTAKIAGENKKTIRGQKKIIKPRKKVFVTLKGKDTLDIFETK